jgi:hypothetical protein
LFGGVLFINLNSEAEEGCGISAFGETTNERGEALGVLKRGDAIESRFDGLETFLLDEIGIHAGGVEVAVFLLQLCFGIFGSGVEFLPQQVTIALTEQGEGASPADLVGGKGILLDPVAARVLIEVLAGIGGFIDGR